MTPIRKPDERRSRRATGSGMGVAKLVGAVVVLVSALLVLAVLLAPAPASGQTLADFDYENLSFEGVMLDVGYVFPSKVAGTASIGGRVDLGLLGPGVRVVAGFNRWSSHLNRTEVRRLEESLESLILEQTGEEVPVNLGSIDWSDVHLYADAHLLWYIPFGMLSYAGVGAGAHVLRGGGDAVDGTFVADFLDSIRAGVNIHTGLELPLRPWLRLVGEARYELVEDLSYPQVRIGGQVLFGR
jgi:hypothetical protein